MEEFSDVFTIQEHAAIANTKFDLRLLSKSLQAVHIAQIRSVSKRPKGNRAIHGAGIDIYESEPVSHATRHGALARSSGAIDCDDDALGAHSFGFASKLATTVTGFQSSRQTTPFFMTNFTC